MDIEIQGIYGFTAKVTEHGPGMYLRFPNPTVESSDLQDNELLQLEIRNIEGEYVEVSRETLKSSGQVKVYLPKHVKEDLDLRHNDLVDVFFRKN